MDYSYRAAGRVAGYVAAYAAGAFLLSGCSRVENIAKEHDRKARIRLSLKRIMEKDKWIVDKYTRQLENFVRDKLKW